MKKKLALFLSVIFILSVVVSMPAAASADGTA